MSSRYLYVGEGGAPMCDKKSPLAEFLFRFDAYRKLLVHALRAGIPLSEVVRARYPFRLPEPVRPIMVSVELCNFCDLECSYCPTRDDPRAKGCMTAEVLARVIDGLEAMRVSRVHVRGWGEPTLHPEFRRFVAALRKPVRYLDIVTNGQWNDDSVAYDLLMAPVDRIDVSVDIGGQQMYEATRKGGKHRVVLENLQRLKALKRELKSRSIVIVRSMFRPSQAGLLREEMAFLRDYADAVIPAPVFRKDREAIYPEGDGDLFTLSAALDECPRCCFPLNELSVCWDGQVPLCENLIVAARGGCSYIRNVLERSLEEIWRSDALRNFRLAHKNNDVRARAVCRGCPTC